MTVLRDPVERTLSFLRHQAERRQRGATEDTPLVEIYEDPFRFEAMIQNHMTRMLSLDARRDGDGRRRAHHGALHRRAARDGQGGPRPGSTSSACRTASTSSATSSGTATASTSASRCGPNTTEPTDVPTGLADRIAEDNALDMELYDYAAPLYEERHR